MKTIPRAILLALLGTAGLTLAGCGDEGAAEEAGEEIDEAAEEAGDAMEDAADEMDGN